VTTPNVSNKKVARPTMTEVFLNKFLIIEEKALIYSIPY